MTEAQMPQYQCHKKVWALKIKAIINAAPGSMLGAMALEMDDPYAPITVSKEFMEKHNPRPGGYFVVYEDGYMSYSPAKAFEEGYTRK